MFYLNKKIINNTSKNLFSLKEIILPLIIKIHLLVSLPFSMGNNILLSIIFFYFFV